MLVKEKVGDRFLKSEKYVNAKKALPDNLVKEIQKYINGAYLYIPKIERSTWGVDTGIRQELDQRNEQIINSYNNGIEIAVLAEGYCLSEERVRAIVFGYAFSPKEKKEEVSMLTPKSFDKEKAKEIFQKSVDKNNLSITFVDVMYLKVHENDFKETMTFYYSTTYKGIELREAARTLVKDVATSLNEPVCLRETNCVE